VHAPTPRHIRWAPERTWLASYWIASLARVATSWALEAERPVSGHELLMRMRGCADLKKNQKADAAASAVAKINNR
jgi:hypothetical protein